MKTDQPRAYQPHGRVTGGDEEDPADEKRTTK